MASCTEPSFSISIVSHQTLRVSPRGIRCYHISIRIKQSFLLVSLQELGQQFQPQAFTTQGSMMISDTPCDHCRFVLYHPIWQYQNSILGLYDDDRFPGGCILRLTQHHESLDELDTSVLNAFMAEIQQTMKVIKQATQTERVNLVILSNTISHIHAHLIP